MAKRNICITAADGQTGHLIAELLLTDDHFKKHFDSIACLALDPSKCKDLEKLGAHVVAHEPGRVSKMANVLKKTGVDAIMVIPPTHVDKVSLPICAIKVELVSWLTRSLVRHHPRAHYRHEESRGAQRVFPQLGWM